MAWIYDILIDPYSFPQASKENNSIEFYNFFITRGAGYTLECICAMLGNIDAESQINPGGKETASDQDGWGLVQWTPATNLIWWCGLHGWNWYDGYAQCEKLAEELEMSTAGQWIPVPSKGYPYSQEQFRQLTDIDEAVKAFVYEYLRPSEQAIIDSLPYRIQQAHVWYQYLTGQPIPPTPPVPPTPSIFDDILGIIAGICGIVKRRRKRW